MCLSIVDEASREVYIFLEKVKTAEQILKDIKSCVQLIEARTGNKLRSFQCDRGSEFHNNIVQHYIVQEKGAENDSLSEPVAEAQSTNTENNNNKQDSK